MSILLSVLLAVAPVQSTDGAMVIKTGDGDLIVPGETIDQARTYEVQFAKVPHGAPILAQVQRAVGPEPFEILAIDEVRATATVKTTEWGAFKLQQESVSVSPSVTSVSRSCARAMAYLDLDERDKELADPPELFSREVPCPGATYAYPQRSLILEGLSRSGKRLWVVAVPDPRWRHVEAIGAAGDFETVFAGKLPEPVLFATFSAPITPHLHHIAWHEIRKDGSVKKLGQTEWKPNSD